MIYILHTLVLFRYYTNSTIHRSPIHSPVLTFTDFRFLLTDLTFQLSYYIFYGFISEDRFGYRTGCRTESYIYGLMIESEFD